MKTHPRLDREERHGVPSREHAGTRDLLGDTLRCPRLLPIQLQRAAVCLGPFLGVVGEIENERDLPCANDIVMAEQVAPVCVCRSREIHSIRQRSALGHLGDKSAEGLAVDRIPQLDQPLKLRVILHAAEILRLVQLEQIALLEGAPEALLHLLIDRGESLLLTDRGDHTMGEGLRCGERLPQLLAAGGGEDLLVQRGEIYFSALGVVICRNHGC
mmetsp:Transcript_9781/g.23325  ORF Transcript_9781/g.23325 Transcript_9781/m.23325 type:complete len:215 (-) Transcript_9781:8-652(-)